MKSEEILDYKKRCAKILGWKPYPKTSSNDRLKSEYSDLRYFKPYDEQKPMYGKTMFVDEIEFDSDWNYIMEVVTTILRVKSDVFQHRHLCVMLELALKSAKKEAVVQAINQFLIWY